MRHASPESAECTLDEEPEVLVEELLLPGPGSRAAQVMGVGGERDLALAARPDASG